MPLLPVIALRGVHPSDEFMAEILDRVARLERYYRPILGCRVLVEFADERHQSGNPYHVRIELTVPGGEIVVRQGATLHARAKDLAQDRMTKRDDIGRERRFAQAAMREAFAIARRRLQDYARRRRGAVKTHVTFPPLHAVAAVAH